MIDEAYVKQLEEENEKLRSQLVKAQETIDYSGATWKEEINDSEVIYRLCLGNFCLGVIVHSFAGEYKCHIIKLTGGSWNWSNPTPAYNLEEAKNACEFALGFGKKRGEETPPDHMKHINDGSVKWMTQELGTNRYRPTIGRRR